MKNPTISTGKGLLIMLAVLVILPVGCAVIFSGGESSTAPQKPRTYETEVLSCAQDQVKNMLKAPSSADFPWGTSNAQIKLIEGTTYEVSSYVDAQNSFGAIIRTNYTCTVTYTPNTRMCETLCQLLE